MLELGTMIPPSAMAQHELEHLATESEGLRDQLLQMGRTNCAKFIEANFVEKYKKFLCDKQN